MEYSTQRSLNLLWILLNKSNSLRSNITITLNNNYCWINKTKNQLNNSSHITNTSTSKAILNRYCTKRTLLMILLLNKFNSWGISDCLRWKSENLKVNWRIYQRKKETSQRMKYLADPIKKEVSTKVHIQNQ